MSFRPQICLSYHVCDRLLIYLSVDPFKVVTFSHYSWAFMQLTLKSTIGISLQELYHLQITPNLKNSTTAAEMFLKEQQIASCVVHVN